MESAKVEEFKGAVSFSGAHFYQLWSLEEKFDEREFASVIVIN